MLLQLPLQLPLPLQLRSRRGSLPLPSYHDVFRITARFAEPSIPTSRAFARNRGP
jgi:hypothetical protein